MHAIVVNLIKTLTTQFSTVHWLDRRIPFNILSSTSESSCPD